MNAQTTRDLVDIGAIVALLIVFLKLHITNKDKISEIDLVSSNKISELDIDKVSHSICDERRKTLNGALRSSIEKIDDVKTEQAKMQTHIAVIANDIGHINGKQDDIIERLKKMNGGI